MNVRIGAVAALSFVCLSGVGQSESGVQNWTDVTGQYSVAAEFVSLNSGEVVLKKESGEVVKIPLVKLSPEHAERARKLEAVPEIESPQDQPADDPFDIAPEVNVGSEDSIDLRPENKTGGMDEALKNADHIDEIFPLADEMQLTENARTMIREKLNQMETPGQTFLWENVRWFWILLNGGGAHLQFTEDGPQVKFDSKRATFNGFASPIPDAAKLDVLAPFSLIGCYLGMVVCGFWYMVVMFRVSVWWFVGHLFLGGIIDLVFLIKYWDEAKRPFLWSLLFFAGIVAALFLFPEWASEYAVLDQALVNSQ